MITHAASGYATARQLTGGSGGMRSDDLSDVYDLLSGRLDRRAVTNHAVGVLMSKLDTTVPNARQLLLDSAEGCGMSAVELAVNLLRLGGADEF